MDASQVDKVTCANCGKSFTFAKGTLSDQGKRSFTCSGCATGTMESRVEANRTAGKTLLTEG